MANSLKSWAARIEHICTAIDGNKGNAGNRNEFTKESSELIADLKSPNQNLLSGTLGTVPESILRKRLWEPVTANDISTVPDVPKVPNVNFGVHQNTETSMFSKIILRQYLIVIFGWLFPKAVFLNIATPPDLDDLTARILNRMGGWCTACQNWSTDGIVKTKINFLQIGDEFIACKLRGIHESDRIPPSRGTIDNGHVFRLNVAYVNQTLASQMEDRPNISNHTRTEEVLSNAKTT